MKTVRNKFSGQVTEVTDETARFLLMLDSYEPAGEEKPAPKAAPRAKSADTK